MFAEDLEDVIQTLESLADVWDVTIEAQIRKEIPIMLKCTAFRKLSANKYQYFKYALEIEALRSWFSSTEKKTRLISEWITIRITDALCKSSDKTKIEVFKTFVGRATAIKQHLHNSYHYDRQIRKIILVSDDIPRIQEALGDRQTRTTHQLVKRVANRIIHKPSTT